MYLKKSCSTTATGKPGSVHTALPCDHLAQGSRLSRQQDTQAATRRGPQTEALKRPAHNMRVSCLERASPDPDKSSGGRGPGQNLDYNPVRDPESTPPG